MRSRFIVASLTSTLSLLGCGSSDDDGHDPSAASGGTGAGGPLSASETFDYVSVEGAVCGNGSPLGIGISDAEDARELAIFLNGGGACWDDWTCFGLNAASHLWTTYSASLLESEVAQLQKAGLFIRDAAKSPFSAATQVFIPYCTGDLFSGDAERDYQADLLGQDIRRVHHAGRPNIDAILRELTERYAKVERVYLLGASAGGYGALLNYERFAQAFPQARVDLLIDGSPAIEPADGQYVTWRSRWNAEGPHCDGCDSRLGALVESLHTTHPDRRFALVTSRNDEVIRTFFGYLIGNIEAQVDTLLNAHYERDNARAFVVDGTEHVLLGGYLTRRGPGGVALFDFVRAWATGDGFASVRP
jgi:hypothetical protein